MTQSTSSISIIFALQINFFYNAFVISNPLYSDRRQLRQDMINETLIIWQIYVLMLFVEQYVFELETRNQIGYFSLSLTAFVFLVNLTPIFTGALIRLKELIKRKFVNKNMKKNEEKKMNELYRLDESEEESEEK